MAKIDPKNHLQGSSGIHILDALPRGIFCVDRLNAKQTEILRLTCKGLRNSEIAEVVGLKERTVKGYMAQLFLIFDVTNRTELVGLFVGDKSDGFVGLSSETSYPPGKKGVESTVALDLAWRQCPHQGIG
jgi:DNA-binding CsgD family transcriptional regulator